MDLREYYAKIRATAQTIAGEWVIVISKKTGDGGKEGVLSEVHRDKAAQLLVEDKVSLASPKQANEYYSHQRQESEKAQEEERIGRVQLAVISDSEIERLRKTLKPSA